MILSGNGVLSNLVWFGTFFFDKFLGTLLVGGGGGGGIEMVPPLFLYEKLLAATVTCACTAGGCTMQE